MTVLITPHMRRWMQERLAARTLTMPSDAPFATVPGSDPDRVLLLGSGPATGLGAATQDLALTGRLAAALAERTGRGAVVEARSQPDAAIAEVQALLQGLRLSRYDGVVVFAGLVDAITWTSARTARRRLEALLDEILAGASSDTTVLLTTVPPVSAMPVYQGLHARAADLRVRTVNRVLRRVAAGRDRVRLVDLPSPLPSDAPPARYRRWAEALGDAVAPVLAPPVERRRPADPEPERVAALAATDLVPGTRDTRFDAVASRARQLLGADAAAVSFIDADSQWFASFDGHDALVVPRSIAICDTTIAHEGPVVIGDLHAVPAWDENPLVHGDPAIRFYAGVPVESADGYRIGTVCVFGTEPREASQVDVAVLQELAAAARAEIWAGRPS